MNTLLNKLEQMRFPGMHCAFLKKLLHVALSIFMVGVSSFTCMAESAKPWQIGFQHPVSPRAEGIVAMHDLLMIIITGIALFVAALLAYVCWRFREKKNPVPSHRSHNTILEILWTTVPVLVLVVIGIPSLKLLFHLDKAENPDMTIKVTASQWYWSYEYPQHNVSFDSNIIPENKLKAGEKRLLEVDNKVVIPWDKSVQLLITSNDVLHSFAVPPMGVKLDAVPGRINETWIRVPQTHKGDGVFYGQCSEICGIKHGFMPIQILVVSPEEFAGWVKSKGGGKEGAPKPQASAKEAPQPKKVDGVK